MSRSRRRHMEQYPARPRAQYDAVIDKKNRTAPRSIIRSEDDELTIAQRKNLCSTARDQERNIALAAWMIRKHLEYVSRFEFQARTPDEGYNSELEAFVREASAAPRFDIAGRHSRQEFMSLLERRAVADGDALVVKLRSGHAQAIEGDRISTGNVSAPPGYLPDDFTHGVLADNAGRARGYAVCSRNDSSLVFERVIPAQHAIHHGYFTRFDQVRGVSPLSTALNTIQDLYEANTYSLIKAKVAALFGVAVKTKNAGSAFPSLSNTVEAGTAEGKLADSTGTRESLKQSLKPGVCNLVDLDTDEDIDVIESHTPSNEFQSYTELTIKIALLALDIPEVFFNAMRGSYSVHKFVSIQYEKSSQPKRDRMEAVHRAWTDWRLALAAETREFRFPRGWTIADLAYEWVPEGTPWYDPTKEVAAAGASVAGCFDSPQRICKRKGLDFYEICREIQQAKQYAIETCGLAPQWLALSPEIASAIITGEETNDA